MTPRRAAVLLVLVVGSPAFAQPVPLAEAAKPGDCSKYTIDLQLMGNLILTQEGGGRQPIKLEARGRHVFAERTLAVDGGLPQKSARFYETATASATVGGERFDRSLPPDRRLVATHRGPDGLLCYSPAGPVTRDELDLVGEQFNPQCLPGLLPGRDVNPNDAWPIGDAAAQAAGQFDRLTKNALVGKLTGVTGGFATFAIEGTAEGTEAGGKVTLTVSAVGKFEIASRRVTELTWKQKDDRGESPVSPASQVEAIVTLRREALPAVPPELADAALAGIPPAAVPPALLNLRHADPKGRYTLTYPRDWHVTGQTDTHLILRLLDRGEFITQATVSLWKTVAAGQHSPPDEFKKAVAAVPGWTLTRVMEEGELPSPPGRWLYRLTAEGKMDNRPVVQTFYLLAGPTGDQLVVTVATRPEKVPAVAGRDLGLVNAIEFRK